MNNLKILYKILLAVGVLGVVAVGAALFAGSQIKVVDREYNQLLDHESKASIALARANQRVIGLGYSTFKFVTENDKSKRVAAIAEIKTVYDEFITLSNKAIELAPAYGAGIKDVQKLFDEAYASVKEIEAIDAAGDEAKALNLTIHKLEPLIGKVRTSLFDLNNKLVDETDKAADASELHAAEIVNTVYVANFIGILLAVVVSFLIAQKGIVSPILSLSGSMDQLAADNLAVDIPGVGRGDELGRMAAAVQVFKQAGLDNKQLRAEQEESKRRAELEQKAAMRAMADSFEAKVGGVINAVTAAITARKVRY